MGIPASSSESGTRQRAVFVPVPGSRTEQLLTMYESALAAAEEARARIDLIKDGIKADARAACPGADTIDIPAAPGWPAVTITHSKPWRVDAKRLKADSLLTYVTYAVQGDQWELRPARGGW